MWLLLPSTRADMTFPRAETPVFVCLSLPAKSTRFSLPTLMWFSPSTPNSLHSTLCSFMFVEPTERFWLPTFITCSISRALLVTNDERSFTYTPVSGRSRSSRRWDWSLESRSRISSW
uniref:Uncharacterized protein n=1 Tax=Xiphophorus maculatus TaxID=8083 RepID=A0A3B5QYK6_XIPMA